jgi:hypothetical protein
MVWVAVLTPLSAVTVKVSVVEFVADWYCAAVGLYVNAPVDALMLTVPPPVEVAGAL